MKTTMLHHFKRPLRVTGIALALALIFGLALSVVIYRQKISDRAKIESMQLFGGGLGGITTLVVVPFWLAAAARVGRERRAARESNPD